MEEIKAKLTYWAGSQKGKDILTVIILILVGLGSFGLGRLSKSTNSPGIKIEYPEELQTVLNTSPTSQTASVVKSIKSSEKTTSGNFFASSRGSKYYPVDCSAGKSIKIENRVYFDTREEAEAAGYELSSSCR